ncbi:hypothetical protein DF164_20675 [Burkholderia stagnalis]|nr:hypothetical protein DF164_20675 [Burkholderia stagnalis]RQQ13938.1 hypothetical protein DF161_19730 [Burkholderia stagnalis]RQQ25117.1 hypothetical protein DF163_23755 [Burkholderia stagnalis]RQQ27614.1 hypothetical protein DF149_23120 [Burkholderia stagnalis]RQQ32639.1 hypothetical protein DF148_19140 [Burkholderia stagnalis]
MAAPSAAIVLDFMVSSRFDSVSSGCAGCVPACIVDSKVTSHIRAKATAGDIFLTGCDYAEKPLGRVEALSGGLSRWIQEDGCLSRCVAGAHLKGDRWGAVDAPDGQGAPKEGQ